VAFSGADAKILNMRAPAKLEFGRVPTNVVSSMQIMLTNTGTPSLTISSIGITGRPAFLSVFSQTNTCASALAPGASCSITVSFKPTAAGPYVATLVITDSSADSPQQVQLTGKEPKRQPPQCKPRSPPHLSLLHLSLRDQAVLGRAWCNWLTLRVKIPMSPMARCENCLCDSGIQHLSPRAANPRNILRRAFGAISLN